MAASRTRRSTTSRLGAAASHTRTAAALHCTLRIEWHCTDSAGLCDADKDVRLHPRPRTWGTARQLRRRVGGVLVRCRVSNLLTSGLWPLAPVPPNSCYYSRGRGIETCLDRVEFYKQALSAADGWYRVETTSPCAVAKAAGLTVACDAGDGEIVFAAEEGRSSRPLKSQTSSAQIRHGKFNRKNRDGFTLTYADIERSYGGVQLAEQMQALARRFGYDDDEQAT